jgi:hypothetical protein
MLYNSYILFCPKMNVLDRAQLSIINAEMAFMNMSPLKRTLLMVGGLLVGSQLACVLPSLVHSAVHPTATAAAALNQQVAHATATSLPDHINMGNSICKITDFGHLGASAQGGSFPGAVPDGSSIGLNCNGAVQTAHVQYTSDTFNTTTFVMGPTDSLPRIGQIGDTLRQLPANDPRLANCDMHAFAAPIGNGGPAYQNTVNLTGGNYVADQITTAGNTTTINWAGRFGDIKAFDIHPETIAGAGGDPYTHGYLEWAIFKWVPEALNKVTLAFQGIVRPSQDCPMYIDQP